jgi:hypothetical protein
MPTIVGQHQTPTRTVPQNGQALDADVVRAGDNATVDVHNAHDADFGIHVQSGSVLPPSGGIDEKFIEVASRSLYIRVGAIWQKVNGMLFNDTGKGFPFAYQMPAPVSGNVLLDWNLSSTIQITVDGAVTGFTHQNLGSRGDTYTLIIEQGGSGMYTIDVTAGSAGFHWGLGGVPDLQTGVGTKSVIRAYWDGAELLASCPTRGA